MTFSSTGEGTMSEGGNGSFEFSSMEVTNPPARAGCVHGYTHISKADGFILCQLHPNSSVKDQAWREMKK